MRYAPEAMEREMGERSKLPERPVVSSALHSGVAVPQVTHPDPLPRARERRRKL